MEKLLIKHLTPPIDGIYHFYFGFFIFQISTLFFTEMTSFYIVCGVAIAKELYDKFIKKTKIDFLDIFCTVLPAIVIITFKATF